jgi:hypothetical protein
VDDGERAVDAGMKDLLAVAFQAAPAREVERVVAHLEDLVAHPDRPAVKEDIVRLVSSLVPSFRHAETGRSLDQRM